MQAKIDKRKIYIITLITIVLIICIGVIYDNMATAKVGDTTEFSKKISFNNGRYLHIKTKIWGLTGDHYYITFNKEENYVNLEEEIIFEEIEIYYKQIEADSLYIYFPTNSFLNIKNSQIDSVNVILKGFMNSEIENYKENYKKMGLSKINIYDGIE